MNILHTMKIILFLSFFVSLGGCKTTITGTVFNGVVSGATVTLSNMENQEVAVATSNESGSFTITFNNSKKSSCYLLEAKGGTVDNAEFIDVLTATYCGSTDIPFNLTPVTNLIDAIAGNLSEGTLQDKNAAAKEQLVNLGLISPNEDWILLETEYIKYANLAVAIDASGDGVNSWVSSVINDLSDQQVSSSLVRNVFQKAHDGVLGIAVDGSSAFPNESLKVPVSAVLIDASINPEVSFILSDAPSWISLVEGTLNIQPTVDQPSGIYSYKLTADTSSDVLNRSSVLTFEILESVTLLQGTLDSVGGRISNEFQDIILNVPENVLTQNTSFVYRVSVNDKGQLISKLMTVPALSNLQLLQLDLVEPGSEHVIHNYLSNIGVDPELKNLSRSTPSMGISSVADDANSFPNCRNANSNCWQDRNQDGFKFDQVLWTGDASFLDKKIGLKGSIPYLRASQAPSGEKKLRQRAFALRSNVPMSSLDPENETIPVLFVHGFISSGNLGGFDYDGYHPRYGFDISGEYFGAFPRLVRDVELNGIPLQPFLFQWRTNIPFEVSAHKLGFAIQKITQATGKKVHVVAHSFGGILSRVLIQGLAMDSVLMNSSSYDSEWSEEHIASLTTVGTPHSGIFSGGLPSDIEERKVTFKEEQLTFPDGTNGVAGSAIRLCEAITCYQMGADTQELDQYRNTACDIPTEGSENTGGGSTLPGLNCDDNYQIGGRDAWFGLHNQKGAIVHQLRSKLNSEGWPRIDTQVLIGLVGDPLNDLLKGQTKVDHIGGDLLISLAGQRMDAADTDSYNEFKPLLGGHVNERFTGSDRVEERFLGFQEFDENFLDDIPVFRNHTNYYLDDIQGGFPDQITLNNSVPGLTIKRTITGYDHRTGSYDKEWVGHDTASEVGLQECTGRPKKTVLPSDCKHNTWQYFNSFIGNLNALDPAPSFDLIQIGGEIVNLDVIDEVLITVTVNDDEVYREVHIGGTEGHFNFPVPFFPSSTYRINFIPQTNINSLRTENRVLISNTDLESTMLKLGQVLLRNKAHSYQLSGSISGLVGTLQIANGHEMIELSSDGNLVFSTGYKANDQYTVSIMTQPEGQECSMNNGNGVFVAEDVTNVQIVCSDVEIDGYTKISSTGADLPDSATDWSCVRDNSTGLIWEKKTTNEGLQDINWTYMNTTNMNGWDPRDSEDNGSCKLSSDNDYCHTEGYVSAINSQGLCGSHSWRMPTMDELVGISLYSNHNFEYFLAPPPYFEYWTGSDYAWITHAFYVLFGDGYYGGGNRSYGKSVRLVLTGS